MLNLLFLCMPLASDSMWRINKSNKGIMCMCKQIGSWLLVILMKNIAANERGKKLRTLTSEES